MAENNSQRRFKVLNIVGARPNFMKVAPLHRAFQASALFESKIIHTGQHYDARMSDVFFTQLEMPKPDIYMGVGSGSHAEQTAKVMTGFEKILDDEQPDLVLVVGDVNSTLACSLVAAKCWVPVAHVEAGLRSNDRRMPEEINRIVTDRISDYLFVTEQSGIDNLAREGTDPASVFLVGNVMIDSLIRFRTKAAQSNIVAELGLGAGPFALMTLHRPSNVDSESTLQELIRMVELVSDQIPVIFPMHPRTRKQLETFGLLNRIETRDRVIVTEPLGYIEFLRLMEMSAIVITDSGGIQEETTFLQVPCLTLRENTERPITITSGTNELMHVDAARVAQRVEEILEKGETQSAIPPLWDGKAAERIVGCLGTLLSA